MTFPWRTFDGRPPVQPKEDPGVSFTTHRFPEADWDAHWVRKRDGKLVPMTAREILQKGFRVLDRADGFVVASCSVFDWKGDGEPYRKRGLSKLVEAGERCSAPKTGPASRRHDRLPAHFQPHVHRARVIRHLDHQSQSLRAHLEERMATGKGKKKREIPKPEHGKAHDADVIAEARKLTRRHAKKDAVAKELRVPLSKVQDGDIVVSVGGLPRKWFGES